MGTSCLLSIGPNTSHTHFFRWRHHRCPFHNRGHGGSVRLTHSPALTQQDFSRARFEFMQSTSRARFFFLDSKSCWSLGKTHASSHPHECIMFCNLGFPHLTHYHVYLSLPLISYSTTLFFNDRPGNPLWCTRSLGVRHPSAFRVFTTINNVLVNTLIIKSRHTSLTVSLGSGPEGTAGSKQTFKTSDTYCQITPWKDFPAVNGRTCSPGSWPTQTQPHKEGGTGKGIWLLSVMLDGLLMRHF